MTGYSASHEESTDDQINVDMSALDAEMGNDRPTKTVSEAARTFRDQMISRR